MVSTRCSCNVLGPAASPLQNGVRPCSLALATHLHHLEQPVRDPHPAHPARPGLLNHAHALRVLSLLVIRLDVRRVEDENIHAVPEAGQERRGQVG